MNVEKSERLQELEKHQKVVDEANAEIQVNNEKTLTYLATAYYYIFRKNEKFS